MATSDNSSFKTNSLNRGPTAERFSATERYGTWRGRRLFGLDVRELDHLGPLLGFCGDQPAKIRRRACERRAAQLGEPRLDLGIGEACVDLLVELLDDLGRRGL